MLVMVGLGIGSDRVRVLVWIVEEYLRNFRFRCRPERKKLEGSVGRMVNVGGGEEVLLVGYFLSVKKFAKLSARGM